MAKSQEIYKLVLICLVSVCITEVTGRPKRSVSPPPSSDACAGVGTNSAANVLYTVAFDDLKHKTQAVIIDAKSVKSYLWSEYKDAYDLDETFIQEKRFMDLSDINTTIAQKIETLKLNYAFVHEHKEYVTVTLQGSKISTEPVLHITKTILEAYKQSLSRCLCSIQIALIASGYTDQVPTKDTYITNVWSGSMQLEVWTAYIVINDGLDLSNGLKEAYKNEIMHS